jgi:hypothetical protein
MLPNELQHRLHLGQVLHTPAAGVQLIGPVHRLHRVQASTGLHERLLLRQLQDLVAVLQALWHDNDCRDAYALCCLQQARDVLCWKLGGVQVAVAVNHCTR